MKLLVAKKLDELMHNVAQADVSQVKAVVDAAYNFGVQLTGEVIIEELVKFDPMLFDDYPNLREAIIAAQNRLKV